MKYHVVAGTHYSADLKDGQKVTTVEGKDLTVHTQGGRTIFALSKCSYMVYFTWLKIWFGGGGGEGGGG